MAFYVFDLDGTLADCQHRIPLMDGTDEGYRAFFAACHADAPIAHVIAVMRDLIAAGHPQLAFEHEKRAAVVLDDFALFGQCCLLADPVDAMQFVEIVRDQLAAESRGGSTSVPQLRFRRCASRGDLASKPVDIPTLETVILRSED